MSLATKNVATVLIGLGLVLTFAIATPAKADLLSDLQAQVQALLAQIAALQGQTGSTSGACFTFTRDHEMGDSGGEVMQIQKFLNSHGAQVAASGAGSPGNETTYFGSLTRAAVSKFQASNGITPTAGYWGPISRAKANSMCTSNGGTGTPVTGNGLKVMLASDSPSSAVLVQNQGIGELAKFTFSNPTSSSVNVTNLGFNRIGVSNDSTLENIYLFNGNARITDPAGISGGSFNFNNSNGLFTIPAGSSVTISVRADIADSSNGQQVGVQLKSVNASTALDSSVSLPISGSMLPISAAEIATATWNGTPTPTGAEFAPSNDVTLFQASLNVNNNPVWLRSLQFENRGSTSDSDFQNLKLYVRGVQVGNTASVSNDMVVFDLGSNPVKLETGTHEVRLVGDIVGGSGESFDFEIRRGTDILLVDSELNQPLSPSTPNDATENTVEGVGLSVVKANSSPNSNVAVGATNVLWGRYEFRATGDNLKIEEISVGLDGTGSANGTMDNVRVMLNGAQVGSTQDITASSTEFSLGSSMILTAGQTAIVEIYGDAKSSSGTNFSDGDTIQMKVTVEKANTEGMSSGDRLASDITDKQANAITVSSSSFSGTKFSGYGDQTMVPGANNARIGSFTLSTGSTEGVNVNSIRVDFAQSMTSTLTDLRLVDNSNGQQIGSSKSSVSSTNTFSVNIPMGVSQTKTIDVYANIQSGANNGTITATVDTTTGGTGASTGQSVSIDDTTLQTITLGSGTLTVTRDAGTPVNSNVIAGTNGVQVGKFNFAAANSSYTVQEVKVKVPADAATSVANVTLSYKDSTGATKTASQALDLSSGSETYATATFTGLSFYVPLNDSADLDVTVDIPTIANGAKSGAAVSVVLDADEGFKAVDAANNQDTSLAGSDVASTASSGYGTKYVKKSVPTVTRLSTGYSGTVAAGTGLYRFTITADAAGSIDWRKVSFTVATNGVTITDWKLYDVTGGSSVQINDNAANPVGSTLSVCPGTSCAIGEAQEVGAGATKTYELRADTVTGWGDDSDSVSISFTEDTSAITNAAAASVTGNMIWSDRSATGHSTTTSDWTNGYLVKDMDNDFRSCNGNSGTCTP